MIGEKYLRKLLAWCPKETLKHSVIFRQVAQKPILNLTMNSCFVFIFSGIGLSIILQAILGMRRFTMGGDNIPVGFVHLFSILLLFSSAYLCARWLRLGHISIPMINLKTSISLTFGFFALYQLVGLLNSTPVNVFYDFNPPLSDPVWLSDVGLSVIFAFSLFRLSSLILEGHEFGERTCLRLAIICLASYGISGILSITRYVYQWYLYYFLSLTIPWQSLFTNIYLSLYLTIWIGWFGGLIGYVAILFLSIDGISRRKLRKRSVYMVSLSIGVAWLLENVSFFVRNMISLGVLGTLWNPVGSVAASIPTILTSLLAVVVSGSLMKGGELKGKNYKFSLAAIFLFAGAILLGSLYSIYDYSYFLLVTPNVVLERPGAAFIIPNAIISLAQAFSLLTIGLLLYRKR